MVAENYKGSSKRTWPGFTDGHGPDGSPSPCRKTEALTRKLTADLTNKVPQIMEREITAGLITPD